MIDVIIWALAILIGVILIGVLYIYMVYRKLLKKLDRQETKMKKIEIEIPEGKKAEWVDGVLTLVSEKPQDITERIKTFEDACEELGDEHPLVKEYWGVVNINLDITQDLISYLKLRIITAALNEGWEPTFDKDEERWYPWFKIKQGGLVYAYAYCTGSLSGAHYGVRLVFKSKELAEYCGKQFIDIWEDFLFG